jgi:flagellar basal body-associated protein FliL
MADEETAQAPPEGQDKKKALIKIAIIIAIFLVADAVGGYLIIKFAIPAYYSYSTKTATAAKEKPKKKDAKPESPGEQQSLEPINLNPAGSAGEVLATEIVIEAPSKSVIEEVKSRDAQVRDIVQTYLSSKTVVELSDISKRGEFKKDLVNDVNAVLKSGKITSLYFKSWFIQYP